MTWFRAEPEFEPLLRALELDSFERVAAHFAAMREAGRRPSSRGNASVVRAMLSHRDRSLDVFVKEYQHTGGNWRFWLRRSKARREFENYGVLGALGLPVAQRVAAGEERDGMGRLRSAWIMTVAVPGQTLAEFFPTASAEERQGLCRQLAEIARTLHASGFFYYDLLWRNILVTRDVAAAPRLVLIDCPRGGFRRVRRSQHRLRDLASIDKSAVQFCRRTERLRLLLSYLGKTELDGAGRALLRACLEYRRRHWPATPQENHSAISR